MVSLGSNSFLAHPHQPGCKLDPHTNGQDLLRPKSLLSMIPSPIAQSPALKMPPSLAQGSHWGVLLSSPLGKLFRLPIPRRAISPVDRSLRVIRRLLRRLVPKKPREKFQVQHEEKRNSAVIRIGLERGMEVVDFGIGKPNLMDRRTSRLELPPPFLE